MIYIGDFFKKYIKNTNYLKYEWIREDPLVKLKKDNDDG